jgi:phosphatidylinositol alpha-1,6-mannosyltransferase
MTMPARPRVLVLTPDFPPARGGIQILMHRLVRHIRRSQVRVLTLEGPGSKPFDRQESIEIRRAGSAGQRHRTAVLGLNGLAVKEAIRFRPDVVLSAHVVMSPAAWLIHRMTRARIVQYLHADETRWRPRLTSFAVRRSNAIIGVSRHTCRLAIDAGADPARLHRIPNGVDLPKEVSGKRSSQPTVVTVARLRDAFKGHDVLLRAMPSIRAQVPEVRWAVVGDGPLRAELEHEAAAAGLGDCVTFTGEITDSERDGWLDRAHVFAMPSRLREGGQGGEGFGIVYLEAGARGLPVVAGNVGGALDAVVDGKTGLLVDPTDHVAVAGAVSELLLDPVRAEELGRAGADRAREFAWPAIAERVETLLHEVAHR